jgi:glycosyltransferase involved in cell wall biosynthesis
MHYKTEKILIVLPNDSLGGAEQVLKMIARDFKESQVEVRFLKRKQADGWNDISSQVCSRYQDANSEYLGMFFFVCSFLFRPVKKYDYIFTSHVLVTGIVGILIRLKLIKKKYFVGRESTQIFNRFSGLKLFLYKTMYRFGYPSVDLLISQTEQMKQSLVENLPWIDGMIKVKVIANPIDLSQVDKMEDVNYEQPFVISAGRLIPEKGYDILIDAFKNFSEEYPSLQLIILGEGRERSNLENKIKKLQLENKVLLKGHVSNVNAYFKNASLCVVSSRIEGFPNVLLQMMSQNNKVVSTKCAGGIDQIDGVVLSETNDVDSLYQAMKNSMKGNTEENRGKFDKELAARSIKFFIERINDELQ